jgi:dTDP-4-dehydrorhamnose reductase
MGAMSRMLVTGGTGYLGRVVCEVASAAGWHAIGLGTRDVDIRDADAVMSGARRAGADVVVHTAYVKDTPDARAVIEDGTVNVARAAHAAGARLIHISTDVVFDGRAGRPYREADPPPPMTDYGRAKAEAERRVQGATPDSLVVRTSLIYGGPRHDASPHETAAFDPSASFYDDEVRCPIQVHDLAAALVELAATEYSGILHVAGPEALTRLQFAERIVGRPLRGGPAPPGRPLDCRLDTSLATSLLQTRLRGVDEVYRPSE